MSTTNIQMTQLGNGVRIVTDSLETVDSVALGIWADVGARHETAEVNGVAHMVEHMLFKGTKKRDSQKIVDDIENVGGHMNAYTSRDITSYHVHLLKEHTPIALDVLSDMYLNSTLPEDELTKERHVILQEIGMCQDTPDDLIFDHYYETAYTDQSAGRPILGPASIVAAMPRDALANHIKGFYTPENTVICAAGNINHDQFVEHTSQHFGGMQPHTPRNFDPAHYTGGEKRKARDDLEQTHVIIGFEGIKRDDPDFYNARALATILGGGMSSRLFQEIREKRGLVYSIFAFYQALADTGQFGIYAGTGPEQVKELVPAVIEELHKTKSQITEAEIERTKTQLKSSILMGRENMMVRAEQLAKSITHKNEIYNPAQTVEKIESINLGSVQALAEKIFGQKPTLSAIGPLDHLESYEKICERLKA